jgi:LysR family transcriptional regulator for bpeEF and oprC
MDLFQAMRVFARVVEAQSFTKAADTLDLPKSTVTSVVQQLEAHLRVRLLNRTTRSISLTAEGATYHEQCVRILEDVEDAQARLRVGVSKVKGVLRVDVPGPIGREILVPHLNDFHARYPELELVMGMSDRHVDLASEAVDCALRAGTLRDSSLVARRLGVFAGVTCASPAYLAARGTPTSIDELGDHLAVNYFSGTTGRTIDLDFLVDGQTRHVLLRGVVAVNDGDAYIGCALQGLGLIQMPRFIVGKYLTSGALREVLPNAPPQPNPLSIVYLKTKHVSPKVKAFIEWTSELFEKRMAASD